MNEQEAFEKLAPILMEMKFERVRRPDMPVGEAVHEGYCTVVLLEQDAEELKNIGYDTAVTKQIEEAVGAFAVAEAKLINLLGEKLEAVKRWKEKKVEGYFLRKQVLDSLRFACRNDREAVEKLKAFSRRPKQAVMILDLHTLAQLGEQYIGHLTAINFDKELLSTCRSLADQLGRLHAESFCAEGPCAVRAIRNRAFTLMKKLVAEARAYVTYLFREKRARLKNYSSAYRRSKYRYRKKAAITPRLHGAHDKENAKPPHLQQAVCAGETGDAVNTEPNEVKEGTSEYPDSTSHS